MDISSTEAVSEFSQQNAVLSWLYQWTHHEYTETGAKRLCARRIRVDPWWSWKPIESKYAVVINSFDAGIFVEESNFEKSYRFITSF